MTTSFQFPVGGGRQPSDLPLTDLSNSGTVSITFALSPAKKQTKKKNSIVALLNHLFVLQFSSRYSFVPIPQRPRLIPTQLGPLLIVSLLLPSFDLSLPSLHSVLPSFLSVIQIHPFLFFFPSTLPPLPPSITALHASGDLRFSLR